MGNIFICLIRFIYISCRIRFAYKKYEYKSGINVKIWGIINLSINIAKSEEKESFVFHPSELRTKVLYLALKDSEAALVDRLSKKFMICW